MTMWAEKLKTNTFAYCSIIVLSIFAFFGLYAPFFASGKPLFLIWEDRIYFPLFRYLFFSGYFTKPIDLFFNILMLLLPLALLFHFFLKKKSARIISFLIFAFLQISLFLFISSGAVKDPLSQQIFKKIDSMQDPLLAPISLPPTWQQELQNSSSYVQLDLLIKEKMHRLQHTRIEKYAKAYTKDTEKPFPSLYLIHKNHYEQKIDRLKKNLTDTFTEFSLARESYQEQTLNYQPFSLALLLTKQFLVSKLELDPKSSECSFLALQELLTTSSSVRSSLESSKIKVEKYLRDEAKVKYLEEKQEWIEQNLKKIHWFVSPLFRLFHWEENAAGSALANQYLPWYETTRINRKDLTASLFFGLRISFFVGITAVSIAFFLGATLGMIAGFFANKTDLFICRIIEIWEAMPTFFMLLLVVAIAQSKSIFIIIGVLGLFGWTNFARFMRAEVLKQRNLPYTLAARSLGYTRSMIMQQEILPNTLAPLLTLLPFAIMAAITSEAALSFLGLGEEGSSSLGVLMDEGRLVFPGESYLLWPAASVLTLLLISIALLGDALRDALDPRTP